jgi:CO/xanthine dehydrogenase FAD-binding subunit
MIWYEYYKPGTISEALALTSQFRGEAMYIAGGTDVMVLLKQKKIVPRQLISLRNIKELSLMDRLTIGACVTHRELQKDEYVKERFSALHDAVCNLGSTQIRNVATIGGNICNAAPSADTACPLLVLGAEAVMVGSDGERRVAIDDFFTGPGKTVLRKGEILKSLLLPEFGEMTGSAYIKHTRRNAMDLPIIGVAVRITINVGKNGDELQCKDFLNTVESGREILQQFTEEEVRCEDIRIALGVVSPRPMRAKKAEAALKGKVISEKIFREIGEIAASEAAPRDSIRGQAWYRSEMIKVLIARAILKSIDRIIRPGGTVYPERLW